MAQRWSAAERAIASAWVLLTLIPFAPWSAFMYAGIRARRPLWWATGVAYGVVHVGAWALALSNDKGHWTEDAGFTVVFATWIAMLVHALAIRGDYVERRELFEAGPLDAAEDALLAREEARRLAEREPRRAVELGVGRPDLDSTFDGGLVDLNNADVAAIENLPGVSRALAEQIVTVREDVGGFESLEDAGHVLDLPAPLLDRIRRHVIVLPRGFVR